MPEIPEKVKTYLWVVALTLVGALLQLGINRLGGTVTVPAPPTTIQVSPIVVSQSPDGTISALAITPKSEK